MFTNSLLALSVQKVPTSRRVHLQSTILQIPPTSHCFRQTVQQSGEATYLDILDIIGDASLLVKYEHGDLAPFPDARERRNRLSARPATNKSECTQT